jgi:hypothetical protein
VLVAYSRLTLASAEPVSARDAAFDPLAFRQHWQVATCPGINRAENKTVDLQLRMLPRPHILEQRLNLIFTG